MAAANSVFHALRDKAWPKLSCGCEEEMSQLKCDKSIVSVETPKLSSSERDNYFRFVQNIVNNSCAELFFTFAILSHSLSLRKQQPSIMSIVRTVF